MRHWTHIFSTTCLPTTGQLKFQNREEFQQYLQLLSGFETNERILESLLKMNFCWWGVKIRQSLYVVTGDKEAAVGKKLPVSDPNSDGTVSRRTQRMNMGHFITKTLQCSENTHALARKGRHKSSSIFLCPKETYCLVGRVFTQRLGHPEIIT